MKWKKTSSEKVVEVLTAKIWNPDVSLRDIEKKTGVNYRTSWDILKNDMEEVLTGSHKRVKLFDRNINILEIWKRIIEKEISKIDKWNWEVKIKSLNDIKTLSATLEDAFKQNQLLWLKPTEIALDWYNMIKDIDSWKITRDNAYEAMSKSKE